MSKKLALSLFIGLGLMLALVGFLGGGMRAAGAATIVVTTFIDVDSNDGVCTLREAINNAIVNGDVTSGDCTAGSGNDTITLGVGTYTLSIPGAGEEYNASGDLDITSGGDLTIVGAGSGLTTIDANGIDRVLHIHSHPSMGSVTISGVTIANGSVSGDGGGIAHAGPDLTLTDVIVRDNTTIGSLDNGGGVFVYQGSLTLDDSQVLSNTASYGGGGVYVNLGTAAITQTDTVVAYNSAFLGGGVYLALGHGRMIGGQIVSNTANVDGGGVFVNMSGSAFTQTGDSTIGYNTALNRGGGIHVQEGSASLSGGQIISNTASGADYGDGGGGVYVGSGSATLNGARILCNTAWSGGGVFVGAGDVTLNGGQINYNNSTGTTSEDGGGGVFLHLSGAVFTQTGGSTIGYNTSNRSGGGVHIERGSAYLSGGEVVSNTATSYGGGVYVHYDAGTLTVSGGQILSNTAYTGGGVYVDEGVGVFSEARIGNNAATGVGGEGGGLYIGQGSATLSGGQIIGNAGDGGGGVMVSQGSVALSGGQIVSNTAEVGGGVYIVHSTAAFTQTGDTLIAYNTGTSAYSSDCGGGVLVYQGRATLNQGQIVRNTAANGGAGLCNYEGTLTLVNGTVSHNTAAANVGGGMWLKGGTTTLTFTTVASNTAASGGYGIHIDDGTVHLRDTIMAYGGDGNCNISLTSNGHNLQDDSTCGLTGTGDITTADPLLGPLTESGGSLVHPLLAGSPAIDAGECISGITTDQRGTTRPQGDECDIGAFEQVPPVLLPAVLRNY